MRKLVIQRSFMESCHFPWLFEMENWALEQVSYSPEIEIFVAYLMVLYQGIAACVFSEIVLVVA